MKSITSKVYVGFCIYCGRDGVSDEHWMPKWLGGLDVLVKGSCEVCQDKINRYIENPSARGPFWSARKYLPFQSQSKSQDPLPVFIYKNNIEKKINISLKDNPALLMLFTFIEANIFTHSEPFQRRGSMDVDVIVLVFDPEKKKAFEKLHPCDWYSLGNIDYMTMSRLFAKIALGYAVATLGYESFRPLVRNLILHGGRADAEHFVGGFRGRGEIGDDPRYAHCCQIRIVEIRGKKYVSVDLQLFERWGMPVYSVVVGEEANWKDDYDTAKAWGISEQKLQRLRSLK